jgi:hypothetical protein
VSMVKSISSGVVCLVKVSVKAPFGFTLPMIGAIMNFMQSLGMERPHQEGRDG